MKFILQVLTIAAGACLSQLIFPWWSMAVVAFALGYLLKSNQNFIAGFIAIALLWSGYAYLLDAGGNAPLAERVAAILKISKPLLILATAFLGGLIGGLAALSGSLLKPSKRESTYY